MFKSPSRSTERGGAVNHRLANSCRQPIEQGECLREHIGIWRLESARRSVDRSVSRIDLSPAGEKANEWRMQAGLQG